MPVRFQVDPDFYDHPKTTGMSDAAFALWVRAGSFSAAKLTDGFISEDVLAHTLRRDPSIAEELVRRRLWRRVKGGWKFHEWGSRNLTKQRVNDDLEADRERKRKAREEARKAAGQNENGQVNGQIVRPDSDRSPPGIRTDSERIPASSVSVSVSSSVSSSVSGSGRGSPPADRSMPELGPEPPPRCPKHLDDPTDDPCRGCQGAREIHEAWERERVSRQALARSAAAKDRAIARKAEIDACTMCDSTGYRAGRLCTHNVPARRRT